MVEDGCIIDIKKYVGSAQTYTASEDYFPILPELHGKNRLRHFLVTVAGETAWKITYCSSSVLSVNHEIAG